MAKVIDNNFVRLYDEDAIELALDDGTYVQVFYTATFSDVRLFWVNYKVLENVELSQVIMLDECGLVINDDDNSDYNYYKNVTLDIIFNKINSYDYRKMYKTLSKDFIHDMI